MAKLNQRDTIKALHIGRVIMVTLGAPDGASYALDNGVGIAPKVGRALTRESASPQGDLFIVANEDGLFPGFSQTYKAL